VAGYRCEDTIGGVSCLVERELGVNFGLLDVRLGSDVGRHLLVPSVVQWSGGRVVG
jgi:hypothetical protein